MKVMTTDEVKAVVRAIRSGSQVDGVTLGEVVDGRATLSAFGVDYVIQGSDRLRVTMVPRAELARVSRRAPAEHAVDSEGICEECGRAFKKSKFNPYFTKCPDCRGRKAAPAEARTFTCPDCGAEFTVSKFQPYLNPGRCQKCSRKAAHKRYMARRAGRA